MNNDGLERSFGERTEKVFWSPFLIRNKLCRIINKQNRAKFLWLLTSSLFFFIIVPSVTIFVARYIEKNLRVIQIFGELYGYLGVPFLVYGGYFVLESIRILFIKGNGIPLGDLVPVEQSRTLIIDGVYNKTRNPMLFGYLISFIGLGFLLNSLIMAFLFPIIYLGIWTIWIKRFEEPALEKRFGESYNKYKKNTPFLIPKYLN